MNLAFVVDSVMIIDDGDRNIELKPEQACKLILGRQKNNSEQVIVVTSRNITTCI
jgi:hypothetical protein